MSSSDELAPVDVEPESDAVDTAVAESDEEFQLSLEVTITDVGPCKKHIRVRIPRDDIDHYYAGAVDELADSAAVPGFRVGHVPRKLVEKRFRQDLSDQVRQKVLVESLEQLSEEHDLDPINEPNLDVENIEIPEQGDFEYEFDVEVRPEFDLPDYHGLSIRRPVREITDDDIASYLERFLSQYGQRAPQDGAAEAGDYVTATVSFEYQEKPLVEWEELTLRLMPVLRFRDAELEGFDELMKGCVPDESRETDLTISHEAETLEMRGETVHARFTVHEVKQLRLPELTKSFLQRIGFESEEELHDEVREMLERQVTYEQRQAVREQVLEKITESADWDLPEQLVLKQVDNALNREILEMQQAGFTTQEIQARENEIHQRAISTTRRALKEHFVLDKIAEQEHVEVDPADIESEIRLMAIQRGDSPRRVRARLMKSGMIENLEAQIRERKAVDVVLNRAVFEDYEQESPSENRVEAIRRSVCGAETTFGGEVAELSDDSEEDNASEE